MNVQRIALCIVVLVGAMTACKKETVNTNEVVVGEYGSMTGSEANFGQSTHNGLLMAVDEINAHGGIKGKPVRLVNYDDQGKTSEVGTAVTRLIQSDHVAAVIGEVASSLSIAGGQIAQQNGVPMISPSSTNPKVTETGDYVFRVCFIDPFQGYVMARFATDAKDKSGLGIKKAAILIDQRQAYAQGLAKNFEESFTKLGGQIVAKESYQGGDQDFSAQLTRIKSQNPEALFIPGYYTDIANVAKQVRAMGITVPLLGGDGWESVQDFGGDAIQGAYYSNHYSADEKRPAVQDFVKKYQARFSKVPDSMSALGYDSLMLLKNAMERATAADGALPDHKAVRDALAATKDFSGVTGTISMDANRNAQKPAVVLKIVGKTSTAVASISPQ